MTKYAQPILNIITGHQGKAISRAEWPVFLPRAPKCGGLLLNKLLLKQHEPTHWCLLLEGNEPTIPEHVYNLQIPFHRQKESTKQVAQHRSTTELSVHPLPPHTVYANFT